MSISRQYRADSMFKRPRIKRRIFTDIMTGTYKYLDRNSYAQVFSKNYLFTAAYPMEKKSLSDQGLREFIGDFGVMDRLVCNRSKEHTSKGTDFMKEVQKHRIDLHVTYSDIHNQSNVEGVIIEMCKEWLRVMLRKKVPQRLWDYGHKWMAEIMQRTASSLGSLHYRTSLEEMTGGTHYILEYLDIAFYYWCWYSDNDGLE